MKTIGILGSRDMEIVYIKDAMEIKEKIEYSGFSFYVGYYKGLRVIVSVCGIGKDNASCCTQILVSKFNVDYLINFGIAYSLRADVSICDIVVGHNVTYFLGESFQMKGTFPDTKHFIADEYLESAAIQAFSEIELKEYNFHLGKIVSGDSFELDNELNRLIMKKYTPYCVEMECAAIAHVAFMYNIPSLIIRGISGGIHEITGGFTKELSYLAAFNVSKFTMKILDTLKNREILLKI